MVDCFLTSLVYHNSRPSGYYILHNGRLQGFHYHYTGFCSQGLLECIGLRWRHDRVVFLSLYSKHPQRILYFVFQSVHLLFCIIHLGLMVTNWRWWVIGNQTANGSCGPSTHIGWVQVLAVRSLVSLVLRFGKHIFSPSHRCPHQHSP